MSGVSVIISNRNDTAMLAVTVRSCIEELRALPPASNVVICDNSDKPVFEKLTSIIPSMYVRKNKVKIVRQDEPCLFSAREMAAEAATNPYILCLDSHMLCGRDMILDLYNFMESKKDDPTLGFAHAPISWAHQHESVARHDRDMSQHELGAWGTAYPTPRTITWKGMPWICRRDWFLDRDKGLNGYGALAEHHVSWGGGDMHIGVKPWLLGFKNWAVPTNAGIHIGPFPKIDQDPNNPNTTQVVKDVNANQRYRLYTTSGFGPHTVGFLISCYILGGEAMMNRNKAALQERFGRFINIDKWWQGAMELGANERKWLDARKVMTFDQLLKRKPWENGAALVPKSVVSEV